MAEGVCLSIQVLPPPEIYVDDLRSRLISVAEQNMRTRDQDGRTFVWLPMEGIYKYVRC